LLCIRGEWMSQLDVTCSVKPSPSNRAPYGPPMTHSTWSGATSFQPRFDYLGMCKRRRHGAHPWHRHGWQPSWTQGMWVSFGRFFVFSNFYSLSSHNKTRVASTNLQRNICRNRIESWTSFDLVMVIRSACLLVS
jgi:hypothetical protein